MEDSLTLRDVYNLVKSGNEKVDRFQEEVLNLRTEVNKLTRAHNVISKDIVLKNSSR